MLKEAPNMTSLLKRSLRKIAWPHLWRVTKYIFLLTLERSQLIGKSLFIANYMFNLFVRSCNTHWVSEKWHWNYFLWNRLRSYWLLLMTCQIRYDIWSENFPYLCVHVKPPKNYLLYMFVCSYEYIQNYQLIILI